MPDRGSLAIPGEDDQTGRITRPCFVALTEPVAIEPAAGTSAPAETAHTPSVVFLVGGEGDALAIWQAVSSDPTLPIQPTWCTCLEEGGQAIMTGDHDAVVVYLRSDGPFGLVVIDLLCSLGGGVPVVSISDCCEATLATEAVRHGALAHFTMPELEGLDLCLYFAHTFVSAEGDGARWL